MDKHNLDMAREGKVISVNISEIKGTAKKPVNEINLIAQGVEGDAHISIGDVQVSILSKEIIGDFSRKHGKEFKPGDFAENITIEGFNGVNVNLLDYFTIGGAKLEVTRIGKKCNGKECSIFKSIGDCIMPKEGIFLRVLEQGLVQPRNTIKHIPRVFNFKVITLSNRVFAGEYEDASGQEIINRLKVNFEPMGRPLNIAYTIIPDNEEMLKCEIEESVKEGYDVILTNGGTGISHKDITCDVVMNMCDKLIPGITEFIRFKYGQTNPHALLSRSVAGVINSTLIYTIPGSLRAVSEYMDVILEAMEHLIYVLNGLSH